MKLTELEPQWFSYKDREKVGIIFKCPCGCGNKCALDFENPEDGKGPISERPNWKRSGKDFETLTLSPSIHRVRGCKWHGYIRNGEIINA